MSDAAVDALRRTVLGRLVGTLLLVLLLVMMVVVRSDGHDRGDDRGDGRGDDPVIYIGHSSIPLLVPPPVGCDGRAPPPRWPTPPVALPTRERPFIFFHDRKTGGTTLRYNLWKAAQANGFKYVVAKSRWPTSDRMFCTGVQILIAHAL